MSPFETEDAEAQAEDEPAMARDDIPGYDFEVKEQDHLLPIANIARIMKTALPENAKISREAKECIQECVSEFISFITSEAAEKCQQDKRKTVNGEDILFALASVGFENHAEALKIYLARYRENLAARSEDRRPNAEAVVDRRELPPTRAVEDEVEDRDDTENSLHDRVAGA